MQFSPKFWMFVIGIATANTIVLAIADVTLLSAGFSESSDLAKLSQSVSYVLLGFTLPIPNLGYVESLVRIFAFNYKFLGGDWQYFRWIFLMPFNAAIAFGLIIVIGGFLINLATALRNMWRV